MYTFKENISFDTLLKPDRAQLGYIWEFDLWSLPFWKDKTKLGSNNYQVTGTLILNNYDLQAFNQILKNFLFINTVSYRNKLLDNIKKANLTAYNTSTVKAYMEYVNALLEYYIDFTKEINQRGPGSKNLIFISMLTEATSPHRKALIDDLKISFGFELNVAYTNHPVTRLGIDNKTLDSWIEAEKDYFSGASIPDLRKWLVTCLAGAVPKAIQFIPEKLVLKYKISGYDLDHYKLGGIFGILD